MYIPRTIEKSVRELSLAYPVVLLTGARQVGKSTVLLQLAEQEGLNRQHVSLDELGPRSLAQEDPELFLQRYPAPLIIDEVQHAPALLDALKPRVDRAERQGDGRGRGAYWLTGSQHFGMMRAVSESLAGRVAILELYGLSGAELGRVGFPAEPFRPDRRELAPKAPHPELLPVYERIVHGSFPRLQHDDAPPWEVFYGSYLQTYLERDVRALLNVANLQTFQRFLRLTAARAGQLLNYSKLARDAGVAVSTAREWILLLEATRQVILLRPYYRNLTKRQLKTPKLYFTDTGLVCYLTGWRTAEVAASGAMAGPLLECFVVSELQRSYSHRARDAPLWYFRTKEGKEVDVLIEADGSLFPIEIKHSASPGRGDLGGIRELEKTGATLGPGALICFTPEAYPLSPTIEAWPVGALW